MLYHILHCFFICQWYCLTDRKQNFCVIHISIPKPGTIPSNLQIPNRYMLSGWESCDSQALHCLKRILCISSRSLPKAWKPLYQTESLSFNWSVSFQCHRCFQLLCYDMPHAVFIFIDLRNIHNPIWRLQSTVSQWSTHLVQHVLQTTSATDAHNLLSDWRKHHIYIPLTAHKVLWVKHRHGIVTSWFWNTTLII